MLRHVDHFSPATPVPVELIIRAARRPEPEADASPVLDTSLALALLRHMVQPAILMDPDGRVTLVNAAGLALIAPPGLGAPQGRFWWELWPHADRADLRSALAIAAGGETARVTLDCRRTVASSAMVVPLDDGTGRIVKLLCLLRAR